MTTPDIPTHTVLSGTLSRYMTGWRWSDGTPEPRISDLDLLACAPNFRCATYGSGTVVEVPHDWRERKHWPNGRIDMDAANAVAELIRDCGEKSAIYAEGLAEMLDDHRARKHGYTIPIEQWDAVLREPCGASWDKEHEAAIFAHARALGWGG